MPEHGPTLFDLQPGRVLRGRFEIRRSARQTGMSQSFEVQDRDEDALRELAVFPAALFETQEQSKDFADVMRAWREIESPHVVRVRDVVSYPDGALLVSTDPPPGRSLREWLKEHGRLSAEGARRLGIELCEGLGAVHSRGLVHGDLKPSAIHVEADGEPSHALLVDGGITPGLWKAKHLGDRTVLIGTPYYAPVEQFGGESPSVRSDLYNLATVLYELVVGEVPWAGRNFLEVFQAKLAPPPPMKERDPKLEVPAAFEEAVLRGLQASERERYPSAEDFGEALSRVRV